MTPTAVDPSGLVWWTDLQIGQWKEPDLVIMWVRGHACVFPELQLILAGYLNMLLVITIEYLKPQFKQLKNLTHQAKQMVKQQGGIKSPATMFVAMLALLSCWVGRFHGETYCTRSALVHLTVWTGEVILAFTNDIHMMGGFSDKHITPFIQLDLIILVIVGVYLYVGPVIKTLAI